MSRTIYISDTDKQMLQKLIEDAIQEDVQNRARMRDLSAELSRARVLEAVRLPRDAITMNSTVVLLLDGMEEEISLVYPQEAEVSKNRISVLSPIGTAILGYREGDTVEWRVPSGKTVIKVKKVSRPQGG